MTYNLPPRMVEVLEANKELIEAFIADKSAYNRHRMHTMLAANGFRNQMDRERLIGLVAHSRRWGQQ